MKQQFGDTIYVDSAEAASMSNVTMPTFYRNAKGHIKYRFLGMNKQKRWYKESDVIALRDGQPTRMATITLKGMYKDWEKALRMEGYEVDSQVLSVERVPLTSELVEAFHLSPTEIYVRRKKITFADRIPICFWYTYTPERFVDDDLFEDMKNPRGSISTVERIKERHGLAPGIARDRYPARPTTMEEQNILQLSTDETIINLQRVTYTKDKQTLLSVQDMILLASWFAPEHEYSVDHWD